MPAQGRRYYSPITVGVIWSRSGGFCTSQGCTVQCLVRTLDGNGWFRIGDFAHIEAASNRGPRANPSLSRQERDSDANIILLCPNHHREVDAQEDVYTVKMLRWWKTEQETRYMEFVTQTMQSMSSSELEMVVRAVVDGGRPLSLSFTSMPPQDKIVRNDLTRRSSLLINLGMAHVDSVSDFVKEMTALDRHFTERLVSSFADEYQRQRAAGLEGDVLFEAMHQFSTRGMVDRRYQGVGLAALVYLFERCAVFES